MSEKILVKPSLKARIISSEKMTSSEKDSFLRYISYLTPLEQEEFAEYI